MINRDILKEWVIAALTELGGKGRVLDVAKWIWIRHENELRSAGDLFYTWQYDIRWAAQKLRNEGKLKAVHEDRSRPWELA